ncbi:GNAT superfamily N-acetyltransferase [Inhella inkyongensis]|uniref:GNAT superfamily N-acetyltransferase n=1 Tax=Inhella inkyongensis TaxID=392593 RepID=A0A840S007_9BURK|nr:GNAT family N-acetyltransferase [Inhella inkyongensis]MBB5203133.1 GNAT superfamily N-acetyltransferase [Inhella inkyongensis]
MTRIRRAEPQDATALQALYARCIAQADWLPEAARQAPNFAAVSVGETVLVAEGRDGALLGLVSVQPDDPFVHHLYVDPQAQGLGLGRALLAALDPLLPKPWRLKCVARNRQALRFYAREGWQEEGRGESSDGPYLLLRKNG